MSVASVSGRNRISRKIARLPLNTSLYRITFSHDRKWVVYRNDGGAEVLGEFVTFLEADRLLHELDKMEPQS